jgi:uncharacterized membrane protein
MPIPPSPLLLRRRALGGWHDVRVVSAYFSGPLPHPSTLAGYEDILPGCADRILTMAEQQIEHRRDIESRLVDAEIVTRQRGQACGLMVVIACVLGGVYLLSQDKNITGLVAMLTPISLLVAAFIGRSSSSPRTRATRRAVGGAENELATAVADLRRRGDPPVNAVVVPAWACPEPCPELRRTERSRPTWRPRARAKTSWPARPWPSS